MKEYFVKLKHSNGYITLKTIASSQKQAIKIICNAENAPQNAIIKITEGKTIYFY